MGKIFDTFSKLNYKNENEVEQKFVTPFLREFLGYNLSNLLFKRRYKIRNGFKFKKIQVNRKRKLKLKNFEAEPDIIVANDREYRKIFYKKYYDNKNYSDKGLFIIEVKNPKEKLKHHLEQKNAYCMAVHTNISVMTNGKQFYIFDFNELLIACENLAELDIKFDLIKTLLHKDHQFDIFLAKITKFIGKLDKQLPKSINYSDFWHYVKTNIHIPEDLETLGVELKKITNYGIFNFFLENNQKIEYKEILLKIKNSGIRAKTDKRKKELREVIIIEGNSGVGKTYLLDHLKHIFTRFLYQNEFDKIPILLELKYWDSQHEIIRFIQNEVNIDYLNKSDIRRYLIQGRFLLLLDAYDEINYNLQDKFLNNYKYFKKQFPHIPIIITVRKGLLVEHLKDDLSTLITLKPPEINDLKSHVQKNLNIYFELFYTHLIDKKLVDLAQIPLFLNYLIIYYMKFSNFPDSIYDLLDKLIQNYFEDHIKKKYIKINSDLLNVPKIMLSKLAFIMIYQENKLSLSKQNFSKIFSDLIESTRNNFELQEIITNQLILDFLIKTNFIVFENSQYSFWHPLLLKYFASIEFAEKINSNQFSFEPDELFHNFNMKDIIILSFPLIKIEKYVKDLKDKNNFLYIESLLQKSDLTNELLNYIKDILLKKLNSEFSLIRKISMELLNKFFFHIDYKVQFLIDIIKDYKDHEILKWALNSLGKTRKEDAYNFIKSLLNKFDTKKERDYWGKPLKGYVLIALSYYDKEEVQELLIDEIDRDWHGIYYLKMISEALENISKRDQLSQDSLNKILKIYKQPKDFGFKISIDKDIRKALDKVLITLNKIEFIEFLITIIKDESQDPFKMEIERVLAQIIKPEYISLLIDQIKNEDLVLKYRESLANILRFSDLSLDFQLLMELLQHFKDIGIDPEKFDLNLINQDFDKFKLEFPAYQLSYLFHSILECFLKEYRILNFNADRLISFLKHYLTYPHELILEDVYKILSKYDVDSLLKHKKVNLDRSVIEYMKTCANYDIERVKLITQKYINLFLTNPEKFHDHLLIQWMLDLLLDSNETAFTIELYNKYIEKDEHLRNIIVGLKVLNKFPSEYAIEVLIKLKNKIMKLEDYISELGHLIFFLPPINNEEFVKFCLEVANILPKSHNVNELMVKLTYIKPHKFEKELIAFLDKKISEGYNLVGALNVLFFIGTQDSIKFLSQFLSSENELLRNKAFSCIKYIYEHQNMLWYNGEEIIN